MPRPRSVDSQRFLSDRGGYSFWSTYHAHLNGPRKLLIVRKRVGPLPAHRLASRHALPRSSDHHSSSFSSSSDSLPVNSLGLDTSDQAHYGSSITRIPVDSIPSTKPVMGSLAPPLLIIPTKASFEDMPIDLDDVVRDFYHHMSEVCIDRIVEIETAQKILEADQLIARGQRLVKSRGMTSLRTMTITRSGMTPEAIEELVNRRVEEALAAHEVTRAANALRTENQNQNAVMADNWKWWEMEMKCKEQEGDGTTTNGKQPWQPTAPTNNRNTGGPNVLKPIWQGCIFANNYSKEPRPNQRVITCFECGAQGHYRKDCPKLKNQNRGNKARVPDARGKAYVLGGGDVNSGSNTVTCPKEYMEKGSPTIGWRKLREKKTKDKLKDKQLEDVPTVLTFLKAFLKTY
ncbi:putative reverse transcriptase domain-containing protein [Tanacetum coccineum]